MIIKFATDEVPRMRFVERALIDVVIALAALPLAASLAFSDFDLNGDGDMSGGVWRCRARSRRRPSSRPLNHNFNVFLFCIGLC